MVIMKNVDTENLGLHGPARAIFTVPNAGLVHSQSQEFPIVKLWLS